jgi:hypothetical protein
MQLRPNSKHSQYLSKQREFLQEQPATQGESEPGEGGGRGISPKALIGRNSRGGVAPRTQAGASTDGRGRGA